MIIRKGASAAKCTQGLRHCIESGIRACFTAARTLHMTRRAGKDHKHDSSAAKIIACFQKKHSDPVTTYSAALRHYVLCCSRNTNSRCNNKMSLKEARGEVNEHIDQHEDTATTQRRGGRLPLRASGWILLLDQLRVQVKKMTKLCQVDSSLKMSPLLVTSALLPATSPPGKRRACLPGKSSTSPSSLP